MAGKNRLTTTEPWVPLREERWEMFAVSIAEGKSVRASYLGAGYKGSKHTAQRSGTRLLAKPLVCARVAYIKNNHHLCRDELLALLAKCTRSPTSSLKDRITAAQECSRMMGWNRGPKQDDNPIPGSKLGVVAGSAEWDKMIAAATQAALRAQDERSFEPERST